MITDLAYTTDIFETTKDVPINVVGDGVSQRPQEKSLHQTSVLLIAVKQGSPVLL